MNGVRHSLFNLAAVFPPLAAQQVDRAAIDLGNYDLITADDLKLGAFDSIRAVIEHPDGIDRSADVARCARDLVQAGYPDEIIVGILMNPDNAVSGHILEQKDKLRAATRALEQVRRVLPRIGTAIRMD